MVVTSTAALTHDLRAFARSLGFVSVGIARAETLPDTRRVIEERIGLGLFEGLPWFTAERAGRATDPEQSLPGALSVVTLAAPYWSALPVTADELGPAPRGRIARYAWGRDYHRVIEKKLKALCGWLDERVAGVRSRPLVDYGPLAERAYAARAGIGWIGKSTNLLAPGIGSWTLLADLITTADLDPDTPLRKSCGACTRCIAACPTGAIDGPYVLDSRRCISFQTIEQRGVVPRALRPLHGDWLFGCDGCQDACPVPSAHTVQPLPEFAPAGVDAAAPPLLPMLSLSEDEFRARFSGRPLIRAKRDGLLRNACIVLGNVAGDEAVSTLGDALDDASPIVRGHAAWALGRIGGRRARVLLDARRLDPDPWVAEEIALALDDPGRASAPYDPRPVAAWLAGR